MKQTYSNPALILNGAVTAETRSGQVPGNEITQPGLKRS